MQPVFPPAASANAKSSAKQGVVKSRSKFVSLALLRIDSSEGGYNGVTSVDH